jgi:hypothetical protein
VRHLFKRVFYFYFYSAFCAWRAGEVENGRGGSGTNLRPNQNIWMSGEVSKVRCNRLPPGGIDIIRLEMTIFAYKKCTEGYLIVLKTPEHQECGIGSLLEQVRN